MPEPTIKCPNCKTEFQKRRLRCTNCNEIGIHKLYKYVRFHDYSLDILKNKRIWCSTGETLNDPFEFSFHLSEMHINGFPIDAVSLETAIRDMKQLRVLSLSEINDNILMWSHYSESHTGFCIEFERTDSNELGNWDYCMPVLYDDNLPTIKPIELGDKKVVSKIFTTKSELWSYEREWRILVNKGNQIHDLPGNITGIVFVYRMPFAKRREIVGILGDTVTYMHAVKSATKFAVDIKPVSLSDLTS